MPPSAAAQVHSRKTVPHKSGRLHSYTAMLAQQSTARCIEKRQKVGLTVPLAAHSYATFAQLCNAHDDACTGAHTHAHANSRALTGTRPCCSKTARSSSSRASLLLSLRLETAIVLLPSLRFAAVGWLPAAPPPWHWQRGAAAAAAALALLPSLFARLCTRSGGAASLARLMLLCGWRNSWKKRECCCSRARNETTTTTWTLYYCCVLFSSS